MKKAEHLVMAAVVQLLSFIRIDMVHHQCDVCLRQVIKAASFGKDPADQLIIYFNRPFLVWSASVTIKYAGSLTGRFCPLFNRLRIRKLTAIVCQDDQKKLIKAFLAKSFIQPIECINHGL